jgi:P-type Cu+ transporter
MRAAPIVITHGRLYPVLEAFDLARRTVRLVRQNLFWGVFNNTAGISLAADGVLHPVAAGARVLSSLSVIGNAACLHRSKLASVTNYSRNLSLAFRI